MLTWWLIAGGGLLGSSHCVGMCGGFAMMVGLHRPTLRQNLLGQLVFSAGRIASYATLGGVAGYAGGSLAARVPAFIPVPAILSLVAGLFLVWQGAQAAGLLGRKTGTTLGAGCLFGSLFSTLLKHPALRNAFSAGVMTGLLPCGLVYAFLSLAASQGDLLRGAFTMIVFGAGTVPLMVLTGLGAMLLNVTTRQRVWRLAAWSVMLTGALTMGRGISFLQASDAPPAARCPLCQPATASASPYFVPVLPPRSVETK